MNQVAKRAGISQSALNRQVSLGELSDAYVIKIARAYGQSVTQACIMVGLLTKSDLEQYGIESALADASDEQIANEVWSRLMRGTATDSLTDGHKPSLSAIDFGGDVSEPRGGLRVADDSNPHKEQDEGSGGR